MAHRAPPEKTTRMKKDLWLLLAGTFARPAPLPQAGDIIIAVDGGIRHAAALQVVPQWWIDDFDSSGDLDVAVPRLTFPVEKDETDLELALDFVRKHYPNARCLMMIGADGDEADHRFANLWVLPRFDLPALLFDRDGTRAFAPGGASWHLHGQPGDKVSVFALTPLQGLRYQGLRWPADNMTLSPFVAHAARNALAAENASVHWHDGAGVIFTPPGVRIEWAG